MNANGSLAPFAQETGAAASLRRRGYRALEVLIVLLAAPFVVVLMIPIAVLVLSVAGRPVLFSQQRAGLHGKPFTLRKFRTMTDDRDEHGCLLPDDQRLVPLGGALRRTRLDELPEFWNILKGEMSLIGPRPLLPHTVQALGPEGKVRGLVRPGLTGWAQTSGNARLTNQEKIALDLWYIAHRSLRRDLIVLLRTFHLMLFGDRINRSRLSEAEAPMQARAGKGDEARHDHEGGHDIPG